MIDAKVRQILAPPEWTDVVVINQKKFWRVSGMFNGNSYTGTRKDPVSLARDLDAAARGTVLPPRKPEEPKAKKPPPGQVIDSQAYNELTQALLAEAESLKAVSQATTQHGPLTLVRDETPEGEPLPDTLARFVPNDVADAERKQWLRDRYVQLGHLVNGSSTFGPPSEAVIREHEELERYRGLFT